MSKVLDGIVTDLKCLPQKLSSKTKDVDIRTCKRTPLTTCAMRREAYHAKKSEQTA